MKILASGSKRFDIVGISDPGKGNKRGIAACKCKAWGWILEKIFRVAICVKTEQGKVYLNSKSLGNWLNRVKPNHYSCKRLQKITHNSHLAQKTIHKILRPHSVKLPIGLPNIGNSCYLNAILQVLFHIPEIRDLILARFQQDSSHPILKPLKGILERKSLRGAKVLLKDMRREMFRPAGKFVFSKDGKFTQQDAQEAFNFFTGILNWAPLQLGSRMRLGNISYIAGIGKENSLLNILIRVQNEPLDLQEAICDSFMEEEIHGKTVLDINGVRYQLGPKRKKFQIFSFPNYCLVQLGRFLDPTTKVTTPIALAETLWLPDGEKKVDYEVIGYVHHHGKTLQRGHYTTALKLPIWFHFDDSVVTQKNPPKVSRDVYLLLLKKKES